MTVHGSRLHHVCDVSGFSECTVHLPPPRKLSAGWFRRGSDANANLFPVWLRHAGRILRVYELKRHFCETNGPTVGWFEALYSEFKRLASLCECRLCAKTTEETHWNNLGNDLVLIHNQRTTLKAGRRQVGTALTVLRVEERNDSYYDAESMGISNASGVWIDSIKYVNLWSVS